MLVVRKSSYVHFNGSRGRSGRIHCQGHGVRHTRCRYGGRGAHGAIQLALIFPRRSKGMYLSQRIEALLLGVGVDIGTDNKADQVEERHPGVLGKELLRKGKGQRRGDPANLHDGHDTSAHGSANLVDVPRTGDDTHGREVDDILDGSDLRSH